MYSKKMDPFIPLSVPDLTGNELKYVQETIETGWVSSAGSYVDRFEKEFSHYVGTKHAIAVMNGTAALHISLLLSDVGMDDEVLVPNLTFVAPVNAIKYCRAHPVFMDSEWGSLGMDVGKLESFLKNEVTLTRQGALNRKTRRIIKAIIPMHTLGHPVDMDPLLALCESYHIKVIEDATESLGSLYRKAKTGSMAPLACFSFNGNKIITYGGGGMITTNDEALAKRAKHLSTTAKTDALEYDHDEVGYNYRLVNTLAALGVAQLERMESFVRIKRENHRYYEELMGDSDAFFLHREPSYATSNYWMYALVLKEGVKITVNDMINHLAERQIQARPLWKLMNTLPMFKDCQSYLCTTSAEIRSRIINIPCSTNITRSEIERVVEAIKSIRH